MSQHGCPERLSNRSKAFQEDGSSQPTMELMVETLTGTAFEMTVSPSDTIFAIKSKIFRVEGIPVAQQHLLYNLRELDDALSLREHAIGDGARLRLVLGLRGGPMATRRLPPPEPWRDIERLLHPRSSSEWGECRVTVLVFREGERVNMLRVRENRDGSYSPVDRQHLSGGGAAAGGSSTSEARDAWGAGSEARRENALTAGKMVELRRRMEALSLSRRRPQRNGDKPDIQKTRSEETLSVPSLLDEPDSFNNNVYCETFDLDRYTLLPPIAQDEDRLKLSVLVKRENEEGAILEECLDTEEFVDSALANNLTPVPTAEYSGVGVEGAGVGGWRAFGSSSQLAPPPLAHALFSSSTGDLEALRRNRILPALSRHRNREHLHLSDEGLHLPPPPAPPAPPAPPRSRAVGSERRRPPAPPAPALPAAPAAPAAHELKLQAAVQEKVAEKIVKKVRLRCGFCRKRLTVATVHECRCGVRFCAPHRYAEVHGCAYDYKRPPQLPRI